MPYLGVEDRADDAEDALLRDRTHMREILAILRTRTRHDFTGYRKPTLLRRIQRRMGLHGLRDAVATTRALLRENPEEVDVAGQRPDDQRHRLLPRSGSLGGIAHVGHRAAGGARAADGSRCAPG